MLRNLVTSLLEHERVETTLMKAKEARRIAERMITLGKRGTLHARRQAASVLMKKSVVKKLFDEIAPKYEKRDGGYTRILRVGYRKGDGAPLAFLELVEEEVSVKKKSKKKETKKTSGKVAPKKGKGKATKKKETNKEAAPAEEPAPDALEKEVTKETEKAPLKVSEETPTHKEEATKEDEDVSEKSSEEIPAPGEEKKEDSGEKPEEK
jgi:large subunit ribosomal protein L17